MLIPLSPFIKRPPRSISLLLQLGCDVATAPAPVALGILLGAGLPSRKSLRRWRRRRRRRGSRCCDESRFLRIGRLVRPPPKREFPRRGQSRGHTRSRLQIMKFFRKTLFTTSRTTQHHSNKPIRKESKTFRVKLGKMNYRVIHQVWTWVGLT